MGCSSMCSISTLLKRISSIERMIDIDDCLTMFKLCQFASMDIPFFSRPLSVWCFDNVFSSSVCVFSLYSPYSSFRTFFQLLEGALDHFRRMQEEKMAALVVSIRFQDGADLPSFLRLLLLLLLHWLRLSTSNGSREGFSGSRVPRPFFIVVLF